MKRICAWCQKILEDGTEPVTHGICPECFKRELESVKAFFPERRADQIFTQEAT